MALVGCIIGATAPGTNGINQLIGANVLIGLASAGQLSFNYMIGELVPVKHRGYAVAGIYLCAVPFFGFGPVIARIFIARTGPGWRWDYYLSIILGESQKILRLVQGLISHRWPCCHTFVPVLPPSSVRELAS